MDTVYFANKRQVALYELELKGQISDGHWENASPMDHWKIPSNAKAEVAGMSHRLGRNFWCKRNYGFNSTFLVECVGERMIQYAKLAMVFDGLQFNGHTSGFEWDDSPMELLQNVLNPSADYEKLTLADFGIEADENGLNKLVEGLREVEKNIYNVVDLRKDLAQMTKIFKIRSDL